MPRPLAPRQADVLRAVVRFRQAGEPLTVRRLARAIGHTSTAAVRVHLAKLEARGVLIWVSRRANTLRPVLPFVVDRDGRIEALEWVRGFEDPLHTNATREGTRRAEGSAAPSAPGCASAGPDDGRTGGRRADDAALEPVRCSRSARTSSGAPAGGGGHAGAAGSQ